MKKLLQRIFNKESTPKAPPPKKIVRFDIDEMGPNARAAFKEMVNETGKMTFFEGRIEHGYSQSYVSTTQQCPRCQAPTQQRYAEWIYATQIAPRVMLAPAGYFCTRCPTVIVDEAMIRTSIKKQFRYQGILGLEYQNKGADLFRTWNGQSAIHILDESGIPQGISVVESMPLRRAKSKQKVKSSKRSSKRSSKKTKKRRARRRKK